MIRNGDITFLFLEKKKELAIDPMNIFCSFRGSRSHFDEEVMGPHASTLPESCVSPGVSLFDYICPFG